MRDLINLYFREDDPMRHECKITVLETKVFPAVWIALCHLQDSEGYSQVIRARCFSD